MKILSVAMIAWAVLAVGCAAEWGIPREFPRGSPLEVTESIRQECAIVDDVLAAFQADYPRTIQRRAMPNGEWIGLAGG